MLDASASHQAKDAGQQLAMDFAGEWHSAAILELRGWLAIHKAKGHTTMTFEQFRHEARNQPRTSKAWGALPRIAVKERLIAPLLHADGTPVMRNAESIRTHGHPVRVWEIT